MFIPLWVLFFGVPILISILGDKEDPCPQCCPERDDDYGSQAILWTSWSDEK